MTLDDRLHKYWEGITPDIGPEPCNDEPTKLAILSDLLEIIDIPIYDITDAPPEFCAGYNQMAEATRILQEQLRQAVKEYCK